MDLIGDEGISESFWAVERFGNTLFVAYDDGLLAHDGTSLARVDFGVKGDVDGHRPWREALARRLNDHGHESYRDSGKARQ